MMNCFNIINEKNIDIENKKEKYILNNYFEKQRELLI